ncbi:5-formyltetrahydrofolate cyclo-ligase [Virgibacillus siamensis]|uniref:5-formyltetrahydrofolate cyclo-ligase n=1 Tax=Virgibacillus siamensis TaxID=480071 RepID=A0ABP3R4I7_9BACI
MDKKEMRKQAIKRLKDIPDTERKLIEEKLLDNLLHYHGWKEARSIGVTVSNGFEWTTRPIIEKAWEEGKAVCVPKCLPKLRKMDFYQIHTYDQLEIVYYNLLEPKPNNCKKVNKQEIDLLITPGLLFDQKGYRVGFGGGYYDRFLADFPNRTVSLASEEQVVNELPVESYDVPVDAIITNT